VRTLRSFVEGRWHAAAAGFVPLVDPSTEQEIARASSAGVDFGAALAFARERGGPALREMTLGQRGELLLAVSRTLQARRDELIALSMSNGGATRKDAKFDVDGAAYALSWYGEHGRGLGDRRILLDGDGVTLGRSARLAGQHALLPLTGAAVQVNAFNFPVWGFAEKAACAWLAGMPVLVKPATSTALIAEAAVAAVIESGALPDGALSLICGSTGDLLDRLGPQDVLAFTGSAATALGLRGKANLLRASTRVNVEADSLNAAILGPGAARDGETCAVFLRDVAREITQKTGQKCTAVRRILVPAGRVAEIREALAASLREVVVGAPDDAATTMGPLASAAQLEEAIAGVARLAAQAPPVLGRGRRARERGYFLEPVLLEAADAARAPLVHEHEVFGPVATLLPYDGSADHAARIVSASAGSLVTSLYTDDREFLERYIACGGASSGRLYVGSEKVAALLPGPGAAMPQLLHGGPGRAGGGHELGGARGLELYLQRVAVTGDRALIERALGARSE